MTDARTIQAMADQIRRNREYWDNLAKIREEQKYKRRRKKGAARCTEQAQDAPK